MATQRPSSTSGKPSKSVPIPTSTIESGRPYRKPLFTYPALPRLELAFYFSVVIGCIIYAYTRIYQASRVYNWEANRGMWSEFEDHEWPFGLGTYRKDVSNDEWKNWAKYIRYALPWFIGHFIILNVSEKLFSRFCTIHNPLWGITLLVYWLLAHCVIFGWLITLVCVGQGFILYLVASKIRSRAILWIFAVILLYPSMNNPIIVPPGATEYLPITLMSYKVLHYLSYTLDMLGDDSKTKPKYTFLEMMQFAFYLPYTISLIIISKDCRRQWAERDQRKVEWASTLFFGLRMLFWYCVAEMALYFFYFEALMSDPYELGRLRKDTLVNVGMAVGQFFHLKYVVIFGVPAFFAKLDRMQPPAGPICTTRLTLYSKIWRYFDRGLYAWFKEYIYLPLCRPTFSIWRKLSAIFVTYSFVLLWHGWSHDYMVWVILSVCEIFLEQIARAVYSIPSVKVWREKRISDTNFRRIIAWLQVVTFAFGLYSNFYFLGSSEAGWVFADRIFWQETVTVRWPFILLICLGYCMSHMCIEVERWEGQKAEKERLEKEGKTGDKGGKKGD